MIVTDITEDKRRFIQLCTVRSALRLEILGMKRSRSPSAYVIAKRDFGLTGNRKFVLEQLNLMIANYKKEMEDGKPISGAT